MDNIESTYSIKPNNEKTLTRSSLSCYIIHTFTFVKHKLAIVQLKGQAQATGNQYKLEVEAGLQIFYGVTSSKSNSTVFCCLSIDTFHEKMLKHRIKPNYYEAQQTECYHVVLMCIFSQTKFSVYNQNLNSRQKCSSCYKGCDVARAAHVK